MTKTDIYFTDYFNIDPSLLDSYGAFNISLINDLPLFIDPFLLFNSENEEYKNLHREIIKYIVFLRDLALSGELPKGVLKEYYYFPEVRQNWFGYSFTGNYGSGLGADFAVSLNRSLKFVFTDFGSEEITEGSHLEKLALIKGGVGKDNISDFTTNLIKNYLLNYTQKFALEYISEDKRREFRIPKATFNYTTKVWQEHTFTLPLLNDPITGVDYVLLTPKNILTKDDTWINRADLIDHIEDIPSSIDDDQLRAKINQYLLRQLAMVGDRPPSAKEKREAAEKTVIKFPILYDEYIRTKEKNGDMAVSLSDQKVHESESLYIKNIGQLAQKLSDTTPFYTTPNNSYDEVMARVIYMKEVIENNDGYKYFYVDGQPIERESDLGIAYRLTWFGSKYNYDTEINNGRGPVDGKASMGSIDTTLVEFKLASNSKLKQNLENQVEVYKKANRTNNAIKVILYFNDYELNKINNILSIVGLQNDKSIVLIDARPKISASNVR